MATATKSRKPRTALETITEFVTNAAPLRAEADRGILHRVKILGPESKNGRRYTSEAMNRAAPLYEGVKVNVNHPPSDKPLKPREYQDRLGVLRNVAPESDGLYADFHYNPKHALAEQLAWDAEHAPENVGFSHNAQCRVRKVQGKQVVESIERVASVDLVADPATTRGLFEQTHHEEITMANEPLFSAELVTLEHLDARSDLKDHIIREHLKSQEVQAATAELKSLREQKQQFEETASELKRLKEENDRFRAEQAAAEKREQIDGLLLEAKLDPSDKAQVSEVFLESLMAAKDETAVRSLIDDRATIFRAAKPNKPRSRPQHVIESTNGFGDISDSKGFVAALRRN